MVLNVRPTGQAHRPIWTGNPLGAALAPRGRFLAPVYQTQNAVMEPASRHYEQRRSFRCAVSGSQSVELRIDGQRYPGRMLDQSAGGFAVLLDRSPQAGEQSAVALHTDAGDFEVRVAFVLEDATAGKSHASGEPAPQRFRVGLALIRDIDPLEGGTSPGLGTLVRLALGCLLPRSTSTMLTGLGLVLLLAAVPVVMLPLFGHIMACPTKCGEPAAVRTSRHAAGPEREGRQAVARTGAGGLGSKPRGNSAFGQHISGAVQGLAKAHHNELRRLASGAPGAAVFELPEVARRLRLTPQQRQHLSQLAERTEASLAELGAHAHRFDREQRAARRQALLDAARHEAEAALDEAQQAQWRQWTKP